MTHLSPHAGGTNRRWALGWSAALGGLLIASMFASAIFDIVRGYQRTISDTSQELQAHARTLAEQTARSIDTVDMLLRHAAEHFKRNGLPNAPSREIHDYLRELATGIVQIDGFALYRADGAPLGVSWRFPPPVENFTRWPFYSAFQEHARLDLYVGPMERNSADATWTFIFARRLGDGSNPPEGAITARARVEYFQQFYQAIQLGPGTAVWLMRKDGVVLARYPPIDKALGKDAPLLASLPTSLRLGETTPVRARSSLDKVDRIWALRAVPNYPLAIAVSKQAEIALAPWRGQVIGTSARVLSLSLMAAILFALLLRQLKRFYATRESLEASEQRYERAMTASNEGHWEWDLVTDEEYLSPRVREMYGLPHDQAVATGAQIKEQIPIHPEDRARWNAALADHLAGTTPRYEIEYRVIPKPGEIRWLHVRALCFRDPNGKPLRLTGSAIDITDRKRAEAALHESEERFALAVAGSNDGVLDWEIANNRMFTSERAMRIFGIKSGTTSRTRDEWLALLLPRIHPEDAQRHADDLRRNLEGETAMREGEYRVRHDDGVYRWFRVRGTCVRDATGRAVRWAGSVSDIDAQRRAEEALRQSEERYALAMTGSNEGHWVWDLDSDNLFASDTLKELVGLAADVQVITRSAFLEGTNIPREDRSLMQRSVDDHLAGRSARIDHDFRIIDPATGRTRWLHTRAQCFRNKMGRALRVAGATIDVSARKHAEEALRLSEERFALAAAGADEGLWDWDIERDRIFFSPRAREIFGLSPGREYWPRGEWLAQALFHPDDEVRRQAAIEAHFAGCTATYGGEFRVRDGRGGYRWVRIRGLCQRDADGRPYRMAGSASDLDAQKRAEEALRQSEERYQRAMSGSDEGHWDWNLETEQQYISPRLKEMYGVSPDTVLETRAQFLKHFPIHPDDRAHWHAALTRHLAGETPRFEVDYRVLLKSGEIRWLQSRGQCARDRRGKSIRLAGSTTDVTDRKRTEEALRLSEERFALAMTGSNEGHWDWNLETGELYLSPRHKEIYGFAADTVFRTREEWAARIPLHPDDRPSWEAKTSEHLAGRTPRLELEYRIEPKPGEMRWVQVRGQCFRDASGAPIRMAGSTIDITERKRAEADRERLEQQLRQAHKLEAMGTLAGGIAHDFNNILAAILGYGEMVQKESPEDSALRRHTDNIMAAGQRAKSLVERILAFSRSGVGERVAVHVQSSVAEALDLLSASLPAGVRLERELAAGDAAVMGDPTQIHQVVMNLCTNALQAMKSGGKLSVHLDMVKLDQPTLISTTSLAAGEYVRLSISDTGEGIPPELLERIFDPFFTTKEVGVGTGLGLALVHGIVTDVGGGINVTSGAGGGTTFVAYFPWHGRAAAAEKPPEDIRNGAGQTVLLVDDEETLVRLGEEMIASLGYEPVGFSSSTAALEAFRNTPDKFDAVLTDESMPGMTGSQLAAEIRKLRTDIPIVLVSGYVGPAMAARARASGADDVLTKPLASHDIARVLATVLRQ